MFRHSDPPYDPPERHPSRDELTNDKFNAEPWQGGMGIVGNGFREPRRAEIAAREDISSQWRSFPARRQPGLGGVF
jgi:hypothetical protein